MPNEEREKLKNANDQIRDMFLIVNRLVGNLPDRRPYKAMREDLESVLGALWDKVQDDLHVK